MSENIPYVYLPSDIKNDPGVVLNRTKINRSKTIIKMLGVKIKDHNNTVKMFDKAMSGEIYQTKEGRKYRSVTFKLHAKRKKELLEALKAEEKVLQAMKEFGVILQQNIYDAQSMSFSPFSLKGFLDSKALGSIPGKSELRDLRQSLGALIEADPNAVIWIAKRNLDGVPVAFIAGRDKGDDAFDMSIFYSHTEDAERHNEVMKYLIKRLKSIGVTPISLISISPDFSAAGHAMEKMGGRMTSAQFDF
ncbi:hypothetical protein KPN8_154 [Klebsiella phage KPN8]|nr:hypothetical protein KPN8_154 [Klebsiella phage KPN8]